MIISVDTCQIRIVIELTASTVILHDTEVFPIPLGLQVRPIAASTGHGLQFQANGGCGKRRGLRDVLAADFRSPHWPGTANRGQWELQMAETADAATTGEVAQWRVDFLGQLALKDCDTPEGGNTHGDLDVGPSHEEAAPRRS
ncbi:hypothetical protein UY3_13516 [Chelonia mydas]|uniref:Uncharacterized protein n=1 Tax=Chelonia mydas TaxID=8469 RepID=M7B1S6_CHEMY|nr:hypothetical protein UY3_13516 [Chelonia mydas]